MTDSKKIKIVTKPSNISSLRISKKIKEKYKNLRKNKILSKKIVESNKKSKMLKEIETVKKVKSASGKKRDKILAQKILKKYKNLKKPKKNIFSWRKRHWNNCLYWTTRRHWNNWLYWTTRRHFCWRKYNKCCQ